jgi:hypothetical protein
MLDSPRTGSAFLLFSFPCIIFKKRLSSPLLGYYLRTKAAVVAFKFHEPHVPPFDSEGRELI